ncbi:hypothetical protein PsAD37_04888 [Pseudovibrio sp. Ad37]|nr:hypothetical protein PsAD37_04888 [Pseudovibrio sp. Ad37]
MCRKCGDNPGRDPPTVQALAGALVKAQLQKVESSFLDKDTVRKSPWQRLTRCRWR